MTTEPTDIERRAILLKLGGLVAATQLAVPLVKAAEVKPPAATGKPGDFDFLSGNWKIKHRMLKEKTWDVFEGEATVHGILGGVASVEDLRIPARNFSGMGLRLLDLERKLWADFWVNSKSGVLTPPPVWGSFVNGVGIWDSEDTEGDKPMIARGVWDEITPTSCRWYQAVSYDGGKSFDETWVMRWTRA